MESQSYPIDRFFEEYKQAIAASGVPSIFEIQEAVVALLENIDSVPERSELWPIFTYIRARLQANDVPLNCLSGREMFSIHELLLQKNKVREIIDDPKVRNIFNDLLRDGKLISRYKNQPIDGLFLQSAFCIALVSTFFMIRKQQQISRLLTASESSDAAFELFLSSITGFCIEVLNLNSENGSMSVSAHFHCLSDSVAQDECKTDPVVFDMVPGKSVKIESVS